MRQPRANKPKSPGTRRNIPFLVFPTMSHAGMNLVSRFDRARNLTPRPHAGSLGDQQRFSRRIFVGRPRAAPIPAVRRDRMRRTPSVRTIESGSKPPRGAPTDSASTPSEQHCRDRPTDDQKEVAAQRVSRDVIEVEPRPSDRSPARSGRRIARGRSGRGVPAGDASIPRDPRPSADRCRGTIRGRGPTKLISPLEDVDQLGQLIEAGPPQKPP